MVTFSNGTEITSAFAPVVTQHSGVVVFTPPRAAENQTYFVYYLPYDQSGMGSITFAWDAPPTDTWTNVATWTPKAGIPTAQVFELPKAIVASQIRVYCARTAKVAEYQPFVRELRLRNGRSEPNSCYLLCSDESSRNNLFVPHMATHTLNTTPK